MTKQPKTIDDLAAAPYNPRRIDDGNAAALGLSLKRFGDVGGIVWNARTGRLVCGHQRVEQLRKQGAQLVKGALQLANGERFAVRVVDWDEAQEKAANLSANNPHIAGEFTDELDGLLSEVLGSLGDAEFEGLNLDALIEKPPDLSPIGDDAVPDLSQPKMHRCPECGYEFALSMG